jgi:hypothetical protein
MIVLYLCLEPQLISFIYFFLLFLRHEKKKKKREREVNGGVWKHKRRLI